MIVTFMFVQVAQQMVMEVQRPASVGNLVEADVLTHQHGANGDMAAMKPDTPRGASMRGSLASAR